MSRYMQNPILGPRALEIQWLNTIVTTHSLICSCEKPWDHLQDTFKNHQIKCHFIGDDHGTASGTKEDGDTDDVPFSPGDLERLFADDTEDNQG
ncbi:MAG: hypothetical protein [Anelloviridae sp.]|nr:MAG: hypothetical protein [Anelloviridae sp.]